MEKCKAHDKIMERIFTEINDIKVKVENVDTKMDGVIEFKNMVHDIIFGKDDSVGLKGKLDVVMSQVNKQWGLLMVVVTAVVTVAILNFWKG